jgi:4-hydroxy-tetrahydrodipicolinate synthase
MTAHSQNSETVGNSPGFNGIIPPLVTPLVDRDTLDTPGLALLIEHVIAGGVSGIFILGTTGEAPSLSYPLRRELVSRACDLVAGRVPVLVGITDTSFIESVRLAEHCHSAGATAVVLAPPYYFPAGQTELISYVEHIVPELPLPLMLYNMPELTKVWFELDSLRYLAELPGIVGIKDSSGDLAYFERLVALRKLRPDWSLMVGPEHLLVDAIRLGADGGVSGGANIFPRLFVSCCRAAMDGDEARAQQLIAVIDDLQRIYKIGKYASRYIKATKCALSLLGICDDFMAEPFHRFRPVHRAAVEQILSEIKRHGIGSHGVKSSNPARR